MPFKMNDTTLGVICGELMTVLGLMTKSITTQSAYEVILYAFIGGAAGAIGSLFIKKGLPFLYHKFIKESKIEKFMKNLLTLMLGVLLFTACLPVAASQTNNEMAVFEIAYQDTLGHEIGYVNHANDPGGETINGVTRRDYPNSVIWNMIDTLKAEGKTGKELEKAIAANSMVQQSIQCIYKDNYWTPLRLDSIKPQLVASELFDTAINQGVGQSGKYLQRTLNFLNRQATIYPDIKVDGAVGKITISTFEKSYTWHLNRYGERKTSKLFLTALNGEQYMRYAQITERNEKLESFFCGWLLNRC